jgi:hypothetical protein
LHNFHIFMRAKSRSLDKKSNFHSAYFLKDFEIRWEI